jgi:monosaccharide-transporting ATPase
MHTGPLSDLTRYRLVSLMLGRAASPGMTVLGVDTTQSADPPLLQATGLTRRHVLTHVSL